MEKAGLAGVGWAARTTDVVQALHSAEALHIHQRFPFSSALKRMSSLVARQLLALNSPPHIVARSLLAMHINTFVTFF